MTSTVTDSRRVNRLLEWLEKQRQDYADMVTDAGDSSLWRKDEADKIRDHIKTVEDMRDQLSELDFLRHEGGPDDVAKIVAELREWDHCWPAPWLEGSVRKAADALDAQAAELARLRGFAEFVTTWAISFRTSDRDETVWTTDQWRELRRQIAALQPTGD